MFKKKDGGGNDDGPSEKGKERAKEEYIKAFDEFFKWAKKLVEDHYDDGKTTLDFGKGKKYWRIWREMGGIHEQIQSLGGYAAAKAMYRKVA